MTNAIYMYLFSFFNRTPIINIFFLKKYTLYLLYENKNKPYYIYILKENRKLNQQGFFFSNVKYLVWMGLSQKMLGSIQGSIDWKRLLQYISLIKSELLLESPYYYHLLASIKIHPRLTLSPSHTVYIYVWQLCGLSSSIFHSGRRKKPTIQPMLH